MDEHLIAAAPRSVARDIASAYLAHERVNPQLGRVTLHDHQVDAASRLLALLRSSGIAVLADATGLGKTYASLAVARALGPALVVAPAALREMWAGACARADVPATFATYEALSRGRLPRQAPLVIADEAHHARNPATTRYAALAELAWGARVLALTATPIHNRRRDLQALLALALGSRAFEMNDAEVTQFVVRRLATSGVGPALPRLAAPRRLDVDSNPDIMSAIRDLPVPVPAADGEPAHALVQLGLIRAWASSEAALRSLLRRRLRRAAAFTAVVESGQSPSRRTLASWPMGDGGVQLALAFPGGTGGPITADLIRSLENHCDGVRAILRLLDRNGGASDRERVGHLNEVRDRHAGTPVVAFTQFADTAEFVFRELRSSGGAAMVTGTRARIAAGHVTTHDIARGFDTEGSGISGPAMPLEFLVATDVLSEGISLRRAGVLVHLDLPWTIARLEQRIGRLRRMGSPHSTIATYAIGPPIGGRELTSVVRALQRKARAATGSMGTAGLSDTAPLLGARLVRAMESVSRRGVVPLTEQLRMHLQRWHSQEFQDIERGQAPHGLRAVVVLRGDAGLQFVTIHDHHCSPEATAFLETLRELEPYLAYGQDSSPIAITELCPDLNAIDKWRERERARVMAIEAVEASSRPHVRVLRALQQISARTERSARAETVVRAARCRSLVLAARGIGAERALEALLATEPFDLTRLESLLQSRGTGGRHADFIETQVQLLLVLHDGSIAGFRAGDETSAEHSGQPA
jgi:superfamily II DNA or RNA helicase